MLLYLLWQKKVNEIAFFCSNKNKDEGIQHLFHINASEGMLLDTYNHGRMCNRDLSLLELCMRQA